MIKGIGASSGIAIAKAYKLVMPDLTVTQNTVEDVAAEIKKFEDCMAETAKQLEAIKEAASKNLSAEEAAVFDAHALVLQDPELKTQVLDKINNEKLCAEAALDAVANSFIAMFEMMDDDYFRERAADIKDVSRRLLANLLGKPLPNPALIDEEVVIIADDLTPSDTAQLNKNLVRGFATNIGGRTSHSAIMARSLEIPAVVACKTITEEVKDGDLIVLDGIEGTVMINPDETTVKEYETKRAEFIAYKEELKMIHTIVKPKYFMPVHGEYRHLKHHGDLAVDMGMPRKNVFILETGQVLELTKDSCKKDGKVRAGAVYVDGLGVGDVGNIVLKDRRNLAQDGMVIIVVTIEKETLSIVSGPDIVTRGFVYVKESEELIKVVKSLATEELTKCLDKEIIEWYVLKGNVKRTVENYIYDRTKRRPTIIPIIMEV